MKAETEVRIQKSEYRSQNTEVRSQTSGFILTSDFCILSPICFIPRPAFFQTASDCEVKLKAFSLSAGRSAALSESPTRSDVPIISTLPGASMPMTD